MERIKLTPQENFEAHMARYGKERGFVPHSQSQLWKRAKMSFEIYSEDYASIMGYGWFVANVLKNEAL